MYGIASNVNSDPEPDEEQFEELKRQRELLQENYDIYEQINHCGILPDEFTIVFKHKPWIESTMAGER